jgi:hypothetical protein
MTAYQVSPSVIIGRIEGADSSYGPGGFAVGVIREGQSGRRTDHGPLEEGPWGYVYGLAGVIDNSGGTGAIHERARERGNWLESVKDGDVLIIGDNVPMVVTVERYGHIKLDPFS